MTTKPEASWLANLFAQLDTVQSEPPQPKPVNPKPRGLPVPGSYTCRVLTTLRESSAPLSESQIRWRTGLEHSQASWALIFLRKAGLVECVRDSVSRPLRYQEKKS